MAAETVLNTRDLVTVIMNLSEFADCAHLQVNRLTASVFDANKYALMARVIKFTIYPFHSFVLGYRSSKAFKSLTLRQFHDRVQSVMTIGLWLHYESPCLSLLSRYRLPMQMCPSITITKEDPYRLFTCSITAANTDNQDTRLIAIRMGAAAAILMNIEKTTIRIASYRGAGRYDVISSTVTFGQGAAQVTVGSPSYLSNYIQSTDGRAEMVKYVLSDSFEATPQLPLLCAQLSSAAAISDEVASKVAGLLHNPL